MSNEDTFMQLPSLVRQALMNSEQYPAKGIVVLQSNDWILINEHIIAQQESINMLAGFRQRTNDLYID